MRPWRGRIWTLKRSFVHRCPDVWTSPSAHVVVGIVVAVFLSGGAKAHWTHRVLSQGAKVDQGTERALGRSSDTRDHRLCRPVSAQTKNIADDRVELDVGSSSESIGLWLVCWQVGCLQARNSERAAHGSRFSRNETRLDQPAGGQIGDRRRVVDVRLTARDVFDVGGVRHHQFECASPRTFHAPASSR
jgi:hypothetical protein